jgi:hypothetical protein
MSVTQPPAPSTLSLPRLLCLHGGGVTAEIFRLQSRSIITALTPYFRLVFADGPFLCNAGPGMIPVYQDYGPYRRWLRWLPEHAEVQGGDAEAVQLIEGKMREAMEADDARGATGEWVGLMGFSQGAKLAASVLYETQLRQEKAEKEAGEVNGMYGGFDEEDNILGLAGGKWKFAICMAGRAPLVNLSGLASGSKTMVKAAEVSEGFKFDQEENVNVLRLPTVHVHGLKDPGLHLHRKLLETYCHPHTTIVAEWEGEHRIPLKSVDVGKVVDATLQVAVVWYWCLWLYTDVLLIQLQKCGVLQKSQINGHAA